MTCFTALLHLPHMRLAIALNLEGKSCVLNNQRTVGPGAMASCMCARFSTNHCGTVTRYPAWHWIHSIWFMQAMYKMVSRALTDEQKIDVISCYIHSVVNVGHRHWLWILRYSHLNVPVRPQDQVAFASIMFPGGSPCVKFIRSWTL